MPKKPRSWLAQLLDLAGRYRKLVIVLSIITGVTGVITGVATAWPHIEPVLLAHRGYVRFVAEQSNLLSILRDVQIELAEGKRDDAKRGINRANIELAKTNDPALKDKILHEVGELQITADKLNAQIRTLTRAREQHK